jgi:hypothetical protein
MVILLGKPAQRLGNVRGDRRFFGDNKPTNLLLPESRLNYA